ncbi:hypothetical protein SLA2020_239190 [Shorea laevis]
MENWSFFLFGGTDFDGMKFAGVFDWFKDKKETDSKVEDLPLFHNGSLQPEEWSVSIKKRKRKAVASDMDVNPICYAILLNLDLKSQHQFKGRLFLFFYLYGLLVAFLCSGLGVLCLCLACAPTGSGKTLAFVSPMLMKL